MCIVRSMCLWYVHGCVHRGKYTSVSTVLCLLMLQMPGTLMMTKSLLTPGFLYVCHRPFRLLTVV